MNENLVFNMAFLRRSLSAFCIFRRSPFLLDGHDEACARSFATGFRGKIDRSVSSSSDSVRVSIDERPYHAGDVYDQTGTHAEREGTPSNSNRNSPQENCAKSFSSNKSRGAVSSSVSASSSNEKPRSSHSLPRLEDNGAQILHPTRTTINVLNMAGESLIPDGDFHITGVTPETPVSVIAEAVDMEIRTRNPSKQAQLVLCFDFKQLSIRDPTSWGEFLRNSPNAEHELESSSEQHEDEEHQQDHRMRKCVENRSNYGEATTQHNIDTQDPVGAKYPNRLDKTKPLSTTPHTPEDKEHLPRSDSFCGNSLEVDKQELHLQAHHHELQKNSCPHILTLSATWNALPSAPQRLQSLALFLQTLPTFEIDWDISAFSRAHDIFGQFCRVVWYDPLAAHCLDLLSPEERDRNEISRQVTRGELMQQLCDLFPDLEGNFVYENGPAFGHELDYPEDCDWTEGDAEEVLVVNHKEDLLVDLQGDDMDEGLRENGNIAANRNNNAANIVHNAGNDIHGADGNINHATNTHIKVEMNIFFGVDPAFLEEHRVSAYLDRYCSRARSHVQQSQSFRRKSAAASSSSSSSSPSSSSGCGSQETREDAGNKSKVEAADERGREARSSDEGTSFLVRKARVQIALPNRNT